MTTLDDMKNELFKNPDFKKEYDALEPEFSIVRALIEARNRAGITQKELSERTGIAQSDISKFESGSGNPSLRTMKRLASGMGMKMRIEFIPAGTE